ncbi:hypothetical protein MAN_08150, partial [Metarhizium hybridum]
MGAAQSKLLNSSLWRLSIRALRAATAADEFRLVEVIGFEPFGFEHLDSQGAVVESFEPVEEMLNLNVFRVAEFEPF